jgi:SAM-dependent methyltransferase
MASMSVPIAPPRTCPACSSDRLGSAPIARFRGCVDCGHVWAPPTEVDNTMFEAEDYVEWRTASGAQQRRQARIAADRLRWVEGSLPASGRSLELGCSTGEVVQALAERSWEAYGVDLSAAAVAAGAARHPRARLAVGTGPTDAGFPADGYDLLCAFHVVEHLPDLDACSGDLEHPLERHPGPLGGVGVDRDPVDWTDPRRGSRAPRPGGEVDAEHRRARADQRVEGHDRLVRVLVARR